MPAYDFYECFIMEQMQPFGERGGDVRAGIVASAVFNSQRQSERAKIFTPLDFVQHLWDGPKAQNQPQTAEQQLHQILLLQKLQDERMTHAHG